MKVLAQVVAPLRHVAANHAVLGKQQFGGTAPGADAEQSAVVPEVAHGLARQVPHEDKAHVVKHPNPPHMAAAHGLVDVKGGAAVLGLFGAVPEPQGLQALLSAF